MRIPVTDLKDGDLLVIGWSEGGNQSFSQKQCLVSQVSQASYGTSCHIQTPTGPESRFWSAIKKVHEVEVVRG